MDILAQSSHEKVEATVCSGFESDKTCQTTPDLRERRLSRARARVEATTADVSPWKNAN